jgi:hypothetical protein
MVREAAEANSNGAPLLLQEFREWALTLRLTGRNPGAYIWNQSDNPMRRPHPVAKESKEEDKRVVGFLGVGLDNEDGHHRFTQAEHFLLVGGSAATHERMQDTAMRFGENLKNRGKLLDQITVEEVIEILHESRE